MTNPRMLNRRFCGHARTLPALTVAALVQEDLLGLSRPKVAGQMSPPPASTTRSFPSIAVNNTQSMRWSGKRSDSPLGTASVMAVPLPVDHNGALDVDERAQLMRVPSTNTALDQVGQTGGLALGRRRQPKSCCW